MGSLFRMIPLLVFPMLLYAAVAMTMDPAVVQSSLNEPFFSATLPSGAVFIVSRGYGFVILAAGLLFIEVIKSTSATKSALIENGLAFLLFTFAFILFLLNPSFGTIEFALIMIMMLIDFMAGFVVMAITSRRDTVIAGA
jgi:hypothetical protein